MQECSDIFLVSKEEAGVRLDKLLADHFPQHSRTYFHYLIEQGCVLVNGAICKKREKPEQDDEIEVCFQLTPELSLEPQQIPLEILFEDEHLIAVNKPAGMVVHPAPGHPSDTFVNALLYHCKELPNSAPLRPGIVHRLDKDTSGVLLAAKTHEAHHQLVRAFSERQVEKIYMAIAVGKTQEGLIDAPIRRHPTQRKQMTVCPEGKPAQSFCRVLAYNGSLSLVEVQLITGRTHQIRVHLKSRGTPVLGDTVYGSTSANKKFQTQRQLLHAHRVRLDHPITKIPLNLCAPIPKDLYNFCEALYNQ